MRRIPHVRHESYHSTWGSQRRVVVTAAVAVLLFPVPAGEASAAAREPKPLTYASVLTLEGQSQSEVAGRAKFWFRYVHEHYNVVLDSVDPLTMHLQGSGTMNYHAPEPDSTHTLSGKISYKIDLIARDGECEWKFSDFVHYASPVAGRTPVSFGLLTDAKAPQMDSAIGADLTQEIWKRLKATAMVEFLYLHGYLVDVLTGVRKSGSADAGSTSP